MAKSPNTTPFSGINYKFTQDYPGWENNFVNALYVLADAHRERDTQHEMRELEAIDRTVDEMTHFPEALELIKKATS